MGWVSGIAVYFVIWWIVLFTVLPWGNAPEDRPVTGHAPSAPANPRLRRKFIVTTVLTSVLWFGVHVLIFAGPLDFYAEAEKMAVQDRSP